MHFVAPLRTLRTLPAYMHASPVLSARSELHFCNGLAFTFVRKLGAGLSFEAGHGFVIRKIYTGARRLAVGGRAGDGCAA